MDAPTAGVGHGLYFSVETAQLLRTVMERLADAGGVNAEHGFFVSDDIKLDKQLRAEAIRALDMAEQAGGAESDSLDSFVQSSLGVPQKAESIRSLLELVESDLSLLYRSATNRTMTVLAILGLILAAFQAIRGF
jgi:hypothetical protein